MACRTTATQCSGGPTEYLPMLIQNPGLVDETLKLINDMEGQIKVNQINYHRNRWRLYMFKMNFEFKFFFYEVDLFFLTCKSSVPSATIKPIKNQKMSIRFHGMYS